MVRYYWDTYALILALEGDAEVFKYLEQEGVTSTLNLMELCAYLLRNEIPCKEVIKQILKGFSIIETFPPEIAIEAAYLRNKSAKRGRNGATWTRWVISWP